MASSASIADRATLDRWPHRVFQKAGDARPRTRTAWPVGLLGMLVLVTAVESGELATGARYIDPIVYSWCFSARHARESVAGRDVLYFGDSLAKHGLIPEAIDRATGRRSYNLAAAAGSTPMTYTLLKRALDSGARPEAIVFDMKPSVMIGGPRYLIQGFAEVLGFREALGLGFCERNGSFIGELLLGVVLPTVRRRCEVRTQVVSVLAGETPRTENMNRLTERNWSVNRGANVATPFPSNPGDVTEAQHEQLCSRGFYANRVNDDYARRFLSLAESKGIRTYLLIAPLTPKLQERRIATGADEKYTKYIHKLQERYPRMTVLDARQSAYPPGAFVDPIHLDAQGALSLSDAVADRLRRDDGDAAERAQTGRWVVLPEFRPHEVPADMEHAELSRARLGLPFR